MILLARDGTQLIATVVGVSLKHARCIAKLLIIRLFAPVSVPHSHLAFALVSFSGQFNDLIR